MKKVNKYDYDKPIKILQPRRNGFDIMFYSGILSVLVVSIFFLIFIHDGKFKIDFVLWRVIICFPMVILAYIFKQLLDELRTYPKLLNKKHIWKIEELMQMTHKNRQETENIMNHVLESAFYVDDSCIKK